MGLFGPEWNSRNFKKAEAAFEKLTEQAEFEQVAQNCRHAYLRRVATGKLTDEAVLIDIAKNESYSGARQEAVFNEHLTDRDALSDIARHDADSDVRWAAKKRLETMRKQELEHIKGNRILEVRKMKDPAALANIAKSGFNRDIRSPAIDNQYLTDQAVFAHIATHDPDEHVRISAIRRITDAAVLDTVKEACCNKDNHIWRSPTRTIGSEEAMQLHFDRLSIYECVICGLEKAFPD